MYNVYHIKQTSLGLYTFRETRDDDPTPEYNEYGNPTDPRRRRKKDEKETSFSVKVKRMTEQEK